MTRDDHDQRSKSTKPRGGLEVPRLAAGPRALQENLDKMLKQFIKICVKQMVSYRNNLCFATQDPAMARG